MERSDVDSSYGQRSLDGRVIVKPLPQEDSRGMDEFFVFCVYDSDSVRERVERTGETNSGAV